MRGSGLLSPAGRGPVVHLTRDAIHPLCGKGKNSRWSNEWIAVDLDEFHDPTVCVSCVRVLARGEEQPK